MHKIIQNIHRIVKKHHPHNTSKGKITNLKNCNKIYVDFAKKQVYNKMQYFTLTAFTLLRISSVTVFRRKNTIYNYVQVIFEVSL